MRLWHIALLLIAGIAVGIAFPGRFTDVFGRATLFVFLPALIFEGAWHLDVHLMRRSSIVIALLAFPGVVLTAGVIALCVRAVGGFDWSAAVLLGVILSATDPVAIIAVFRRLTVPHALRTILESESLLNDAIAVVLYRATIAAVVFSAGPIGIERAAMLAVTGVAAGIAIGGAAAYLAALLLRGHIAVPVQSAATFTGAYASYTLAEHFGWSGIFAVLTFGIVLRELERRSVSVSSARGVERFWDTAAAIANVVLFFLIGAALDLTRILPVLPAAAVTLAAVFIARTLLSYGLLFPVRSRLKPFWQTVVRMAGMRGALSLALALATPAVIAQRNLVINMTFVVVVVTILIGALTLRSRLERLALGSD